MILKGQEGSPTIRLYLRKTMQPPARTPSICDFRLCLNDGICDARLPDSGMRNTLSIRNKILSASECSVLFFFFHIMSTVILRFVTVMNHSYVSVSELPFFHVHVRLHLKIQTELYAFT